MSKPVAIVTDSTCDFPQTLLEQYNIKIVPLKISFGGTEYTDGVDLKKDRFYELLNSSSALPTTSQPPPSDFKELYEKLYKDGYSEIISLHVSGKLSGSVGAAKAALDALGAPGLKVEIIDSKTLSMGLGFLAVKAALAAQRGEGLFKIKEEILKDIPKAKLYFVPYSLDYLKKGGRISRLKALAGQIAHIVPVLALRNGTGEIELVKTCKKKEIAKELVDIAKSEDKENGIESVGVAYTPPPKGRENLASALGELFPGREVYAEVANCVIGAHAGPSTIGVAFLTR